MNNKEIRFTFLCRTIENELAYDKVTDIRHSYLVVLILLLPLG